MTNCDVFVLAFAAVMRILAASSRREGGGERYIEMYMFLADEIGAGPATRSLAEAIRERVAKCL